jgi:hypothetical protein
MFYNDKCFKQQVLVHQLGTSRHLTIQKKSLTIRTSPIDPFTWVKILSKQLLER